MHRTEQWHSAVGKLSGWLPITFCQLPDSAHPGHAHQIQFGSKTILTVYEQLYMQIQLCMQIQKTSTY